MKRIFSGLKIATWMAAGAIAAQLGSQALAHGNFLTRLDVQQAMREVMRARKDTGPTQSEIQQAVRQALTRCRFIGQRIEQGETAADDETDFQGQLIC